MNIKELNDKIYGCKNLSEGENANYKIQLIEERQIENFEYKYLNEINKQIKF